MYTQASLCEDFSPALQQLLLPILQRSALARQHFIECGGQAVVDRLGLRHLHLLFITALGGSSTVPGVQDLHLEETEDHEDAIEPASEEEIRRRHPDNRYGEE